MAIVVFRFSPMAGIRLLSLSSAIVWHSFEAEWHKRSIIGSFSFELHALAISLSTEVSSNFWLSRLRWFFKEATRSIRSSLV